jgi:hypothetical protein
VDTATIAILAIAIVLSAIGITVGLRLVPLSRRAKRDLANGCENATQIKQDQARIRLLDRPAGRRRDSSILDISGNLLRHTDGSFTKAYHVALNNTVFSEEDLMERRINELARLLAARKPSNTIIQFRLSVNPEKFFRLRQLLVVRRCRCGACLD